MGAWRAVSTAAGSLHGGGRPPLRGAQWVVGGLHNGAADDLPTVVHRLLDLCVVSIGVVLFFPDLRVLGC